MKGEKEGELLGTGSWQQNGWQMVSFWQHILLRIHLIQRMLITYAIGIPYSLRKKDEEKNSLRVRNIRHSKSRLREKNTLMMKSYTNITGGRWVHTEVCIPSRLNQNVSWNSILKNTNNDINLYIQQTKKSSCSCPLSGGKKTAGGKGSCFLWGWTPKHIIKLLIQSSSFMHYWPILSRIVCTY